MFRPKYRKEELMLHRVKRLGRNSKNRTTPLSSIRFLYSIILTSLILLWIDPPFEKPDCVSAIRFKVCLKTSRANVG